MKSPAQTAEIFERLSKGQFICSNASSERERRLYDIINEPDNYDVLFQHFIAINFALEKGDEFYYFSKSNAKSDLERKLKAVFKWIDLVDFFKAFKASFASGFRFTPSEIVVKIGVDAVLKSKLLALEKLTKEKNHQESIEKLIKMLCDGGFVELENDISNTYKVLSSFKYLEELIDSINIPDEIQDEIPQ